MEDPDREIAWQEPDLREQKLSQATISIRWAVREWWLGGFPPTKPRNSYAGFWAYLDTSERVSLLKPV